MQWAGLMWWQDTAPREAGPLVIDDPIAQTVEPFDTDSLGKNERAWKMPNGFYVKVRHEGATTYQTIHKDGRPLGYLSGAADYEKCTLALNRLLLALGQPMCAEFKGLKKFLKRF